MQPRVYIETTIPSFYCATRTDPEAVARKNWTQHWWDFKRAAYQVFTSAAVLDELARGDYDAKQDALALLRHVPLLPMESSIVEIAEAYSNFLLRNPSVQPDPVIDQIRAVRHQISEQCGHDPKKLVEYYMKLEKEKYADRVVKSPQPSPDIAKDETL